MYVGSFANDGFLSAVDGAGEAYVKEVFVFEAALCSVRGWGLSANDPDTSLEYLPEHMQKAAARVISFNKAVVCLLDPQPQSFGCSVKDVFSFARYQGSDEPEQCLAENLRQPFWKRRYEAGPITQTLM